MQDKNIVSTENKPDSAKSVDFNKQSAQNNSDSQKKTDVQNRAAADFKRKYFEFYDDIKISDRQDW